MAHKNYIHKEDLLAPNQQLRSFYDGGYGRRFTIERADVRPRDTPEKVGLYFAWLFFEPALVSRAVSDGLTVTEKWTNLTTGMHYRIYAEYTPPVGNDGSGGTAARVLSVVEEDWEATAPEMPWDGRPVGSTGEGGGFYAYYIEPRSAAMASPAYPMEYWYSLFPLVKQDEAGFPYWWLPYNPANYQGELFNPPS
ncbi:MAG: hypothetical protein LBR07_05140 [Puniceicoccales bacterium]|nr:hypothetical protein [Puniceicoccales bacterium]